MLFIFSLAHGHLGCFPVWAIRGKAAMNILKQVSYGRGLLFLLDKKIYGGWNCWIKGQMDA